MAAHSARHVILSETATYDAHSGDLRAVIETPKGSRNKYRYDPECDAEHGPRRAARLIKMGMDAFKKKRKGH